MSGELTPGEIRDAVRHLDSACTIARDTAESVTEKLTGHITDRFGLIRWENGSDRRAYRLWRYRNRRRWWIDV